jgi:hypothetical protein
LRHQVIEWFGDAVTKAEEARAIFSRDVVVARDLTEIER